MQYFGKKQKYKDKNILYYMILLSFTGIYNLKIRTTFKGGCFRMLS